MRRREFIAALGGAAVAWPLAVSAQESVRARSVGMLLGANRNDPGELQVWLRGFQQGIQKLGWTDAQNVKIDYRWTERNPELTRDLAAKLVYSAPDVIFAFPAPCVEALHRETRSIPIVFVQSGDPVQAGFVESLARPGGNITGFVLFEASINTKYLQLLKDIAPSVERVAVIQTRGTEWRGDYSTITAVAPSFGIKPVAILVRDDPAEIERAIAEFAREPNGGFVLPPDQITAQHRDLIVMLAAKYRLPGVYSTRGFVDLGGLIGYSVDGFDIFRRSASYVDRILRGAKPADLPVQQPTKFELVINLKTAKTLGLDISPILLTRADEVIE